MPQVQRILRGRGLNIPPVEKFLVYYGSASYPEDIIAF